MKELRTGVTTGLCAAAAAKASTAILLSGDLLGQVGINAKNGKEIMMEIMDISLGNGWVKCAVRKDAGDDPDVTDGIKVFAAVSKADVSGITIDGGKGVGRVTKPGLKVEVGKAAINPVPMEMIVTAVDEVCSSFAYTGGIKAVISIPGGEKIAKRTMNERLGIIDGLSILGTTGIVEPMSEKAIVETIKAEIDVQMADCEKGENKLLITPGNYGRDFAKSELGLDIENAIKCSNYIGETLDYACVKGVKQITLIGHAGKLVKLAGGIMNTHSAIADCRMEIIAAHCVLAGECADAARQIMDCVTTEAAVEVMLRFGINERVWESIGQKIEYCLSRRTQGNVAVEYIVFTQDHGVLVRGVA